jgi:ornithine cyclodeaminase
MEWIDAGEVHRRCEWLPLIEHLRESHRQPAAEVDRKLMTVADDGFLILPAWQPGDQLGVKVCTVMPANLRAGSELPSVQAVYLLFDGIDGRPIAVVDGTALTHRKTASDSALGADILARDDAHTLLIVGAGAMAGYLAEAHRAVRPSIERVLVWNRTASRAAELAERLGGEAVSDLDAAVASADVISCATASSSPLVRGAMVAAGTHVDLVGSFTPDMRESDSELMAKALVFGDTRWNTADTGDIEQAVADGVIDGIAADLFDLCSGDHPGRTSSGAITVFKNGGGGHLDLMTAAFVGHQR